LQILQKNNQNPKRALKRKQDRSFYAHLRHCEEYNPDSHLNTNTVVVTNNNDNDIDNNENNFNADYEMDDENETGNNEEENPNPIPNPNPNPDPIDQYDSTSLLYQYTLLSLKHKNSGDPFRTGWLKTALGKKKRSDWEDYVLINSFVTSNRLSENSGDKLLQLIQALCMRHNLRLDLPTCFETIKKAIDRAADVNIKLIRKFIDILL
jgi:hypothetical protein